MKRLFTLCLLAFAAVPTGAHGYYSGGPCVHSHGPEHYPPDPHGGIHAHSACHPILAGTVQYEGGCGFDSVTDPTRQFAQDGVYTGVVYAAVVITDPPGTAASVLCEIQVNGVTKTSSTFNGIAPGVVVGADDEQFLATDGDIVAMCETVNGNPRVCSEPTAIQVPPQEVNDAVDGAVRQFVDPIACVLLQAADPADVPGIVEVNGQGDVFLLGAPFVDCPPYDLFG